MNYCNGFFFKYIDNQWLSFCTYIYYQYPIYNGNASINKKLYSADNLISHIWSNKTINCILVVYYILKGTTVFKIIHYNGSQY